VAIVMLAKLALNTWAVAYKQY